jgi:hypothetical protein
MSSCSVTWDLHGHVVVDAHRHAHTQTHAQHLYNMGYTNCNESAMSLGANLINVQRLGLRLTVSFESYKHDLEETKEPKLLQRLVPNPILWPSLWLGA